MISSHHSTNCRGFPRGETSTEALLFNAIWGFAKQDHDTIMMLVGGYSLGELRELKCACGTPLVHAAISVFTNGSCFVLGAVWENPNLNGIFTDTTYCDINNQTPFDLVVELDASDRAHTGYQLLLISGLVKDRLAYKLRKLLSVPGFVLLVSMFLMLVSLYHDPIPSLVSPPLLILTLMCYDRLYSLH